MNTPQLTIWTKVYRPRWSNAWLSQSSNLTPLDVFLLGCRNNSTYETLVQIEEDLLAKILVTAQRIDETPGVMKRVYQNMILRYNMCNNISGHFMS